MSGRKLDAGDPEENDGPANCVHEVRMNSSEVEHEGTYSEEGERDGGKDGRDLFEERKRLRRETERKKVVRNYKKHVRRMAKEALEAYQNGDNSCTPRIAVEMHPKVGTQFATR